MTQIKDTFYAILKPTRSKYGPIVNGQRPVESFAVDKIRRNKPFTNPDEVAVKLEITLDSTIFDEIIPVVAIELGAKDLFVNTEVEILPQEETGDDVTADGTRQ